MNLAERLTAEQADPPPRPEQLERDDRRELDDDATEIRGYD